MAAWRRGREEWMDDGGREGRSKGRVLRGKDVGKDVGMEGGGGKDVGREGKRGVGGRGISGGREKILGRKKSRLLVCRKGCWQEGRKKRMLGGRKETLLGIVRK